MNCVIVCVGTDKISGDSLGPMVGSMLRAAGVPCPVYGVEGATVNGVNLDRYREFLASRYAGVPVIAVDAALGEADEVGQIRYRKGGVCAGGALGRRTEGLGQLAVLGVVGRRGEDALSALLEAPLAVVERLAERIAHKLCEVLRLWEQTA